jgi:hypothetical protein
LNAFLITPAGRKLFEYALRDYKSKLSPANRNIFNNPNAVTTQREFYFWKIVSLLLSGAQISTSLCSLNLARTFVPNLRNNETMTLIQTLNKLVIMSPVLKNITEIQHEGRIINRVPQMRKCMTIKIYELGRNPITSVVKGIEGDRLSLDHAIIAIHGQGQISHALTGVIYNRVQYVADSHTQSVTQCDWADDINNVLRIPFIVNHGGYSRAEYAALVYIRKELNYLNFRHAINYITRPGRARSNATSNVRSASRRTSPSSTRRNLSNNATSRNLTRRVATLGLRRNTRVRTPSPRKPAKKRKVSERA